MAKERLRSPCFGSRSILTTAYGPCKRATWKSVKTCGIWDLYDLYDDDNSGLRKEELNVIQDPNFIVD